MYEEVFLFILIMILSLYDTYYYRGDDDDD